jgi:hypothetical protein
MPIYQNSIIYKICHCNDLNNENIYIGSTTNFRNRKCGHKTTCNNEKDKNYNIFVYTYIRDNGGWDNFVMIPIEVFPCNDKKELEVRERHHIELLKPKLNKVIPTRTQKEYREENKENLAEQKKQYRNDNKEKLLANKKQYREANKEIINQKTKEKVICDNCGCEIRKDCLKRHQKSNKCKNYNITKE